MIPERLYYRYYVESYIRTVYPVAQSSSEDEDWKMERGIGQGEAGLHGGSGPNLGGGLGAGHGTDGYNVAHSYGNGSGPGSTFGENDTTWRWTA